MEQKNLLETPGYFAASNSYKGFISYFDKFFDRKLFDRVFIIKGGPGTGKSSFMKKLLGELSSKTDSEAILCSSDPNSLDGVIFKTPKASIAFIDGTSPHTEDTRLPGVIDEIIDLGKNWDCRLLISENEKIQSLSNEKSKAYFTAYSYLSVAGRCYDLSETILAQGYERKESKKAAEKLISELCVPEQGNKSVKLVSAFCKSGKVTLDTLRKKAKRTIGISGDEVFACLFLEDLKLSLDYISADYILIPSPLTPHRPEALYLLKDDVLISFDGSDEITDCSAFSKQDYLLIKEETKVLETIKRTALDEAKRWFGIASDFHFRLEEIYSRSMDFSKNDEIFRQKLLESQTILGISQ